MAVIWHKRAEGTLYEVRNAGKSIRLYTNGVFHSQYNEDFPLAGSVWDLLVLPALFLPPQQIQRVLVLGVGGGAVVRQLLALIQPEHVTGIELDAMHLHLARAFFGLNKKKGVELIQHDAVAWVKNYRGPKFDMVIDDLFCESESGPGRAVAASPSWIKQLQALLQPKGVLVMNFDSPAAYRASSLKAEAVTRLFNSGHTLLNPGFENRVAALFKSKIEKNALSDGLQRIEVEHGKTITRRLNASCRRLF